MSPPPLDRPMLLNVEEIGEWSHFQEKNSVFCFNFIYLRDKVATNDRRMSK